MANNIMVLGDSKTGKTQSVSTLTGHTVLANFDPAGFHSLVVPYVLIGPNELCQLEDWPGDTQVVVIDYTTLVGQISLTLDRGNRKSNYDIYVSFINDMNAAMVSDFVDNIVVDGLTGLSDAVLGAVMQINKRSRPQFEDWGQAIDKVVEIIMALAASTKNFVLCAHLQTERDELTGRLKELPLVYGKQLPNKILAIFDTVFVTRVTSGIYHWVTNPQPLLQTIGSRTFKQLPPTITQDFELLFSNQAKQAIPASGRKDTNQ
jgi:hypothetical protein